MTVSKVRSNNRALAQQERRALGGRADGLHDDLEQIVGPQGLVRHAGALAAYESDGFMAKARPAAVCLPRTTEEVAALVRLAAERGLPVTPRGAGTGLSGGATAVGGGLVIGTSRMNRILRLDPENQRAVVQPGVVNIELSRAAESYGLYYAPDPSSQGVSTIGGNVAENAGGAHCLKYGVTTNHVLGLEAVLSNGAVVRLGAYPDRGESPGYDLSGLVTGSEGNLAFATAIAVRLTPRPESVRTLLALFASALDAGDACSAIISEGIVPAALEFVDRHVIEALRGAGFLDYPSDAAAVVLVEVEGLAEQAEDEAARVHAVLVERGATEVRVAESAAERARLWAGRKGAAGALGHLAPNYYIQDGVVPRSRMVEVLAKIEEIAARERLRIVNVFHAGDGNLHPTVVFDAREPGMVERVVEAGAQILRACVEAGGTLSGEHGIGLEKQAYLHWVMTPEDQAAQHALKRAFDPALRLNPGKPFSGPLDREPATG
jgi:glycolate oxidase